MTPYVVLDKALHGFAEEAKEYFSSVYGLPKSRFQIEKQVSPELGYRPTLHVTTAEQTLLCVDVVSGYYTDTLDTFVLGCINIGLPVELFLAVPFDSPAAMKDITRAAQSGIGILQVGGSTPLIVRTPVSLSLASVGRPRLKDFPRKYRPAIDKALQTFLGNDPATGALLLYQEIEDLTRRLASEVDRKGCWRALKAGASSPGLRWEKDSWQNVSEALVKHLDSQKLACPQLTLPLLGRILGLSDHRNLVGHKMRNVKDRIKRDREMRPRFEYAADTLRELLAACGPLKF
jgi:hypothetical protein